MNQTPPPTRGAERCHLLVGVFSRSWIFLDRWLANFFFFVLSICVYVCDTVLIGNFDMYFEARENVLEM